MMDFLAGRHNSLSVIYNTSHRENLKDLCCWAAAVLNLHFSWTTFCFLPFSLDYSLFSGNLFSLLFLVSASCCLLIFVSILFFVCVTIFNLVPWFYFFFQPVHLCYWDLLYYFFLHWSIYITMRFMVLFDFYQFSLCTCVYFYYGCHTFTFGCNAISCTLYRGFWLAAWIVIRHPSAKVVIDS
jgi:hypothetical protein